jgi:hypothetical protein
VWVGGGGGGAGGHHNWKNKIESFGITYIFPMGMQNFGMLLIIILKFVLAIFMKRRGEKKHACSL